MSTGIGPYGFVPVDTQNITTPATSIVIDASMVTSSQLNDTTTTTKSNLIVIQGCVSGSNDNTLPLYKLEDSTSNVASSCAMIVETNRFTSATRYTGTTSGNRFSRYNVGNLNATTPNVGNPTGERLNFWIWICENQEVGTGSYPYSDTVAWSWAAAPYDSNYWGLLNSWGAARANVYGRTDQVRLFMGSGNIRGRVRSYRLVEN